METEKTVYEDLLEVILKRVVDDPSSVSIEKQIDDRGILLLVRVARPDVPIVIGKEGATIEAIRRIIKIVGMKYEARVAVKLVETY